MNRLVWSAALVLLVAACGGGSSEPDAPVIDFFDAAPPDAPPPPDAFVCVETDEIQECGPGMAGCVNITEDEAHCGGCDMPCPAGAACESGPADPDAGTTDIAHCECPPDFVPENEIIDADLPDFLGMPEVVEIDAAAGDYAAFGIYTDAGAINALVVTYNDGSGTGTATPLDTDIDLTTVTTFIPSIGLGYNIDIASMQFQAAYIATAGTLRYTYRCQTGAAGSLDDATFDPVADLSNPVPMPGPCSFTVTHFDFTIGEPCE